MTGRNRTVAFGIGILLSIAWALIPIVYFDAWSFVQNKGLNETGDFLAGVFAPLAFAWLIAGYFMQSSELRQQRDVLRLQVNELGLQREELAITRKTLSDQLQLNRDIAIAEEVSSRPILVLEVGGLVHNDKVLRNISIRNVGKAAFDMKIFRHQSEIFRVREVAQFKPDDAPIGLSLDGAAMIIVTFKSERGRALFQEWWVPGSHEDADRIKPRTNHAVEIEKILEYTHFPHDVLRQVIPGFRPPVPQPSPMATNRGTDLEGEENVSA